MPFLLLSQQHQSTEGLLISAARPVPNEQSSTSMAMIRL